MKYAFLLGIAVLTAAGLTAPASAQGGGILRECRSFPNPHSCTCAVNNGGSVFDDPHRPGKKRWQAARRGTPAHMAFMNCANAPER